MKENQEKSQYRKLNRLLSLLAGIKIKAEIIAIEADSIGNSKANATSNYYITSRTERLHEQLTEAIILFSEVEDSKSIGKTAIRVIGDLVLERVDDLIALNYLINLKTEKS